MKAIIRGLIIGGAIIAAGVIVIIITLAANGWAVGPKYETVSYAAQGEISALNIRADAGSVKCGFYDGEEIVLEYPSAKGYKTSVAEKDGALTYSAERKWYAGFAVGANKLPATVIKLPESLKGKLDLTLRLNAGSAELGDGEYNNVTADVNAGQITAGAITADSIRCDADAGQIKISSVCCAKLDITVDAGKARIDRIDAVHTSVSVDAGYAQLGFAGDKSEYTVKVKVDAGGCNIGDSSGDTEKTIDVDIDAGSATVTFGN